MSRIYEALQRADLERKVAQDPEAKQVAELVAVPAIEEPQPVNANVVLENIAQHQWSPSMASFPTLADRGAGVEQFRGLRSRMFQHRYEAPLKTILVCSGLPAEGKTFVTANLAMSLARNNVNNILLIDADLRRPTLHSLLGAPSTPGLSEYLAGTVGLNEIMQRNKNSKTVHTESGHGISNLIFIPAGKCDDNSSELVANHHIEELISTLSPHFDWILIDSPPVLAVADAVDIARAADAVLLVAREGNTPFDVAQRTQAAFRNSRILGFVLNAVKDAPRQGSYSYYYYGGPEASDETKRRKDKRSQA
jgi:capsular exopolysaccharide synthesis family protein